MVLLSNNLRALIMQRGLRCNRWRLPFVRSFISDSCAFGKGKNTEDPFTIDTSPTNLGEDSYYLKQSGHFISLGVADGVGGWVGEGRPDLVAQSFMKHCGDVAEQYTALPEIHPGVSSQILFAQAYERLQHSPPGLGTTTGSVMTIVAAKEDTFVMSSHNLGDSGYLILRKDPETSTFCIHREPQFQRYGDCPLQFGTLVGAEREAQGYVNCKPGEGVPHVQILQKEDIILMATDGLWDNIEIEQIATMCNKIETEGENDGKICKELNETIMRTIMSDWKKFDDVTMVTVQL